MSSSLFWDVTQGRLVFTQVSGQPPCTSCLLKMASTGCAQTSVTSNQPMSGKIPEQRIYQIFLYCRMLRRFFENDAWQNDNVQSLFNIFNGWTPYTDILKGVKITIAVQNLTVVLKMSRYTLNRFGVDPIWFLGINFVTRTTKSTFLSKYT